MKNEPRGARILGDQSENRHTHNVASQAVMLAIVTWRSFGGKVVYSNGWAGVWPPVVAIPTEAGIRPIGGTTPAKTLEYTTFPPKLTLFTTPGNKPG